MRVTTWNCNLGLSKSLGEIANLHRRSKTAISKRLFSMGLTDSEYDSPMFRGKKKFTIHI